MICYLFSSLLCLFDFMCAIILKHYYIQSLFSFFCLWTVAHYNAYQFCFIISLLLLLQQILIGSHSFFFCSFYICIILSSLYLKTYLDTSLRVVYVLITAGYFWISYIGIDILTLGIAPQPLYTLKKFFANILITIILIYTLRDRLDNRLGKFSRGKSGLLTKKVP